MHKIFKYRLPIAEKFTTDLPIGARIIRVSDVDGEFFLWAIVNPEQQTREWRWFECYKTGQPIGGDIGHLIHVGMLRMVIMQELMLYVFEKPIMSISVGDAIVNDCVNSGQKEFHDYQIFKQP